MLRAHSCQVVLGCHYGHDPSCVILIDGRPVVGIAEERLSRTKSDRGFPFLSVQKCMDVSGVRPRDVSLVALPGRSATDELLGGAYSDMLRRVGRVPSKAQVVLSRALNVLDGVSPPVSPRASLARHVLWEVLRV